MRTQLHEPKHRKTGVWFPGDQPFHPWRRVAIAIGTLFLVMLSIQFLSTSEAGAAPGVTCKSDTRWGKVTYAGVTAGKATWHATGCYWNDHAGVKSLSVSVQENYTNPPFEYVGVTSRWQDGSPCATWSNCSSSNHLVIKGSKVRWNFCLPVVGCVPAGTVGWEITFDAYGNLGFRVP